MDLDLPSRQKFTTSRGYSYSYIRIPSKEGKPTLLLLHGWPSHIDDWIYQIKYFKSKGYGLVVPDLLGYGDSSSPSDTNVYRLKPMSQDLAELLDHVKLLRVVGIGHDWGATILSRFALYHPDRLSGLVFLAVGPPSPGTRFDLGMANELTKKATGMEMFGYIAYIARDPAAQQMMEKNAESVMDVMFAADAKTWDTHFHPLGGLKKFVEEGRRQEVAHWFPPELRKRHLETFGREGGYLGSSRYYVMMTENLSTPDEEELRDFKLPHPTIFVTPREPAAVANLQKQMLSSWAPDLKVTTVDAGHWVHMQRPEETNQVIDELLEGL
ncbi:hypothetical protein DL768_001942 [Monosporascus sp. mg162]|nr:hypothetical protein DL768_001942 [Monosporascus sp. mg162]